MGLGFTKGICALAGAALLSGCSINIYTQLPPPPDGRAINDQQVEIHLIEQRPNTYDPPPTLKVEVAKESPPPIPICDEWISLKSLPAFVIDTNNQDISPESVTRAALSRISTVDRLIEKGRNNVNCNSTTTGVGH